MKKGLTMGALLLVCLGLLWAGTWSGPAGVRWFVLAHRTELEEIAADCLSREETVERYWSVRVDGLFPGEHPIVQFSTGGWGLAPSSTYWGFYYSESGRPAAFQNVDQELTPVSEDEWSWTDGTDNGGVTRRIDEHWFTYEAWF